MNSFFIPVSLSLPQQSLVSSPPVTGGLTGRRGASSTHTKYRTFVRSWQLIWAFLRGGCATRVSLLPAPLPASILAYLSYGNSACRRPRGAERGARAGDARSLGRSGAQH